MASTLPHRAPPLVTFEHQWLALSSAGGLTAGDMPRLQEANLLRPGFCEFGAQGVRLKHHCGIVALAGRSLEVLPKIGFDDVSAEASRGHLLRWLRDSGSLPWTIGTQAHHALTPSSLLDAFVAAFLDSVTTLARQGLLHAYRAISDDLGTIRGRIDLRRQVGALAGRADRIACTYDEFDADLPINQLIKAALSLVVRHSSPFLANQAAPLLALFGDVSDVEFRQGRLPTLPAGRQARRYASTHAWATLIVTGLSPAIRSGDSAAPSLLFDMNQLFEKIVSRRLERQAWSSDNHAIASQDTSLHLGRYKEHHAIPLRPDIVVRRQGRAIAVADVKWKHLKLDARGTPKVQRSDVYQMLAYASAFNVDEATLIYPLHSGLKGKDFTHFELLPRADGTPVRLSLMTVDMSDPAYTLSTTAGWHASLSRDSSG